MRGASVIAAGKRVRPPHAHGSVRDSWAPETCATGGMWTPQAEGMPGSAPARYRTRFQLADGALSRDRMTPTICSSESLALTRRCSSIHGSKDARRRRTSSQVG